MNVGPLNHTESFSQVYSFSGSTHLLGTAKHEPALPVLGHGVHTDQPLLFGPLEEMEGRGEAADPGLPLWAAQG